jgi:hypothetical protein
LPLGYLLEWKGVQPGQFSRLVQAVEWQLAVLDGTVQYEPAEGGLLLVIGAYPTRADFGRFYTRHLLPALGEMGLSQPSITSWPLPEPCPVEVSVRFGPWLSLHPERLGSLGSRN